MYEIKTKIKKLVLWVKITNDVSVINFTTKILSQNLYFLDEMSWHAVMACIEHWILPDWDDGLKRHFVFLLFFLGVYALHDLEILCREENFNLNLIQSRSKQIYLYQKIEHLKNEGLKLIAKHRYQKFQTLKFSIATMLILFLCNFDVVKWVVLYITN